MLPICLLICVRNCLWSRRLCSPICSDDGIVFSMTRSEVTAALLENLSPNVLLSIALEQLSALATWINHINRQILPVIIQLSMRLCLLLHLQKVYLPQSSWAHLESADDLCNYSELEVASSQMVAWRGPDNPWYTQLLIPGWTIGSSTNIPNTTRLRTERETPTHHGHSEKVDFISCGSTFVSYLKVFHITCHHTWLTTRVSSIGSRLAAPGALVMPWTLTPPIRAIAQLSHKVSNLVQPHRCSSHNVVASLFYISKCLMFPLSTCAPLLHHYASAACLRSCSALWSLDEISQRARLPCYSYPSCMSNNTRLHSPVAPLGTSRCSCCACSVPS